MKRRQPIPTRYMPPSTIRMEKDSEVGRRIEKGQPAASFRTQADKPVDAHSEDLKNKIVELKHKDRVESEGEIKQLKNFLREIAEEERHRQTQMRQRVEEIVKEKIGKGKISEEDDGIGALVESSSKPKQGSFLARLKKKGKGAMIEARGAVAKGGG